MSLRLVDIESEVIPVHLPAVRDGQSPVLIIHDQDIAVVECFVENSLNPSHLRERISPGGAEFSPDAQDPLFGVMKFRKGILNDVLSQGIEDALVRPL